MGNNDFALVIDDSVSMRQYVMSILRQDCRVGEVLEAESPDHALRLLQQRDGNLQFIVSDWNMPGMPLPDFLRSIQLRPRLAGAPVFLLTAEENKRARAVAEAVRATAVLTKPFDPERLLTLVMAATGIEDRRRAARIRPFIACEVDLGFSETQQVYSGEVVNISESGILLRTAVPLHGVGYVYDIATLTLRPAVGGPIKIYAQILRIEADTKHRDSEKKVYMAFEYGRMDDEVRTLLRQYLHVYNPHGVAEREN